MENWAIRLYAVIFVGLIVQPATAQEVYVGVYGGGAGINYDHRSFSSQESRINNRVFVVPIEPDEDEENAPEFVPDERPVNQLVTTSITQTATPGVSTGGIIGWRFGNFRTELDVGVTSFEIERTIIQRHRLAGVPELTVGRDDVDILADHYDQMAFLQADLDRRNSETKVSSREIATTLTANALVDVPLGDNPLVPYVGGGIGVGWVNDESVLTWNLQSGVGYSLTNATRLTFGYKFQRLEETKYGDLDAHMGRVGLSVTLQ